MPQRRRQVVQLRRPCTGWTLLRIIDSLLGYTVAFVTVLGSAKRQRLGDMATRTLVVGA